MLLRLLLLLSGSGLVAVLQDLDEVADGVRRLGAFANPRVDFLEVKLDNVGMREGVVDTHLLDVAAVARHALVGDNDAIVRTLFCSVT